MKEQQELQKKKIHGGSFGTKKNTTRNKVIIFLLVTNLLTIFFTHVYIKLQYPDTVIPEHPANVPASAVWHGGSKGGDFYELVDIKDDIYRIRVYYDYSGELYLDSDYKLEPIVITKENFYKMVPYFSSDNNSTCIRLKIPARLNAIYPAYGGSLWEMKKKHYPLKYPEKDK